MNRSEPGGAAVDAVHRLGLRLEVWPWERAAQVGAGNWWACLIGSLTSNEPLGLLPWYPEAQPVVCLTGCEASLVASSTATLIPMAVFRTQLDPGSVRWNACREVWPGVRAAALKLHRELGGTDELASLESVLFDDGMRDACDQDRDGDAKDIQAARAEVLSRLDPEPRHQAYRGFIQRLIETGFAWPPAGDLGPWFGSAANAAFSTLGPVIRAADPALAITCTAAMLNWPSGLGLCHPGVPVHVDSPAWGIAARLLRRGASFLSEQGQVGIGSIGEGQRMLAIGRLAAGDLAGAWMAYAESAAEAQTRGEWSAAWNDLLCATFWQAQAEQSSSAGLLATGQAIAARGNWRAVGDCLAQVEVCYNDAETIHPITGPK